MDNLVCVPGRKVERQFYIQDQLVLKLLQSSEFIYVVRQAGLEPATYASEVQCFQNNTIVRYRTIY